MIIRRCNICPATASECPENSYSGDELRKSSIRSTCQNIPEGYQCKTRTYIWRQQSSRSLLKYIVPDVRAINSMKTERSGYRSPIVAETEGNHS
jgi:hypothetical protein